MDADCPRWGIMGNVVSLTSWEIFLLWRIDAHKSQRYQCTIITFLFSLPTDIKKQNKLKTVKEVETDKEFLDKCRKD